MMGDKSYGYVAPSDSSSTHTLNICVSPLALMLEAHIRAGVLFTSNRWRALDHIQTGLGCQPYGHVLNCEKSISERYYLSIGQYYSYDCQDGCNSTCSNKVCRRPSGTVYVHSSSSSTTYEVAKPSCKHLCIEQWPAFSHIL